MKKTKKILLSLLLLIPLFVSMEQMAQAAEMDADVGIEFTDIEPEPPGNKPKPPVDQSKSPINKVIQLPQTGEKKSQGFTIMGAALMLGAGIFIYKRKSGVTNE